MSEFLQNVFNALFVVATILEQITFEINSVTISFMDTVIYSALISLIVTSIRGASKNGLFTLSSNKKENLDNLEG